MTTQIWKPEESNSPAVIEEVGRLLRTGGTVIIPTETVYGLAANALDSEAVAKIFEAKGRPQDNPLIVHISDMEMLPPLVREIPQAAHRLAEAFWPGPLTIILPKSDLIPERTSGGMDTVAIRMPSHPLAQAVIKAAGVPLAAPSANRSGSPSPTTARHCIDDMDGRVDAILSGGSCQVGVESTVVTLCGEKPRLLRPGGVTAEQLREVLGELEIDPGTLQHLADNVKVSSPGMKYKHYAPKAEITLVKGDFTAFADYIKKTADSESYAVCFEEDTVLLEERPRVLCYGKSGDHAAQAHAVFELLRRLDELGAKTAYIHAPTTDGMGLAVYNRLIRAAAFRVITL